ncbi:uncharacterized protein LOC127748852 isoform X2 [Frankliniella occidentalis]|nr:uncharacterized protein LOC127748852 isoform X2 [Frankliniella occidentalis]
MCHQSTSGQSRLTRLVNICYQSKWTVLLNAYGIFTFVTSSAGAETSSARQFNFRITITIWSGLAGVLIQRKRKMIFSIIQLVADVADRAYRLTDKQGKAAMEVSAAHSRVHTKVFLWYGGVLQVAAGGVLLVERSKFAEILLTAACGPEVAESSWYTAAVALDYLQILVNEYNAHIDCTAVFLSLSCISMLTRSIPAVQAEINRGVERGHCQEWAPLQSQLSRAGRELEETFSDLLPHVLISAYFTPLLAVVEVSAQKAPPTRALTYPENRRIGLPRYPPARVIPVNAGRTCSGWVAPAGTLVPGSAGKAGLPWSGPVLP